MAEKEYVVHFPVFAEYAVRVTIDTDEYPDEDELMEAVLEKGYDILPAGPGICCTGWASSDWSLELEASNAEPHYVMEADTDKVVWGDPDKKLGW